jgi:hypothetical protein
MLAKSSEANTVLKKELQWCKRQLTSLKGRSRNHESSDNDDSRYNFNEDTYNGYNSEGFQDSRNKDDKEKVSRSQLIA